MPQNREHDLVELVDTVGQPIGESTVERAHTMPGQLHRAFSVLLVDPDGRLLLQRRAAVKTRFPLRWANTCCGHPAPSEPVRSAAARRLAEEIGITAVPLTEIGLYVYRADDPVTGNVEHEYDHVLLGRTTPGARLRPDPAEVAETRWLAPEELTEEMAGEPDSYAPWLAGVAHTLATRSA